MYVGGGLFGDALKHFDNMPSFLPCTSPAFKQQISEHTASAPGLVHLEQMNFLLWFCSCSGLIISAAASVAPHPPSHAQEAAALVPHDQLHREGQSWGGTRTKEGVSWRSGEAEERNKQAGALLFCYVRGIPGSKELYH